MSKKRLILIFLPIIALAVGYWAWLRMGDAWEREATDDASATVRVAAESSNWPGLFGPFNNSKSSANGLNFDWSKAGPPVVWRRPIGTGYSSPIVWEDRLILLSRKENDEVLECRDLKTGEPIWQTKWPTAYRCKYEYSSGPYSTPTTDGERVYAVGAEGRFVCVDLKTGDRVWERNLVQEYNVPPGNFAVGASPLLDGDRLIFNLGGVSKNAGIIALDKTTGRTLWAATTEAAGYATPRIATMHGKRLLFVFSADGLVCLNPTDGKVHWSLPFKATHPEYINATSPLIAGDRVLISVQKQGTLCLQVLPDLTYKILWKTRRGFQSQYSTLIHVGEFVYGFHSSARTFCCVRLADGGVLWSWPPPGEEGVGRGQAIAVENRFVLFGEYGNLASLEINSRKAILKSLSGELLKRPCYTSPALAGGLLVLRNEREVVCFDVR